MNNYPPGAANDPRAPYNQPDIEEEVFEIKVSITLSKEVKVSTDDYICEYDDFEKDVFYDLSETNWDEAYKDEYYTISQMLAKLQEYIEKDIQELKEKGVTRIPYELRRMLKSCQNWEEMETEYETL